MLYFYLFLGIVGATCVAAHLLTRRATDHLFERAHHLLSWKPVVDFAPLKGNEEELQRASTTLQIMAAAACALVLITAPGWTVTANQAIRIASFSMADLLAMVGAVIGWISAVALGAASGLEAAIGKSANRRGSGPSPEWLRAEEELRQLTTRDSDRVAAEEGKARVSVTSGPVIGTGWKKAIVGIVAACVGALAVVVWWRTRRGQ